MREKSRIVPKYKIKLSEWNHGMIHLICAWPVSGIYGFMDAYKNASGNPEGTGKGL